jgi:hypothetical protein
MFRAIRSKDERPQSGSRKQDRKGRKPDIKERAGVILEPGHFASWLLVVDYGMSAKRQTPSQCQNSE